MIYLGSIFYLVMYIAWLSYVAANNYLSYCFFISVGDWFSTFLALLYFFNPKHSSNKCMIFAVIAWASSRFLEEPYLTFLYYDKIALIVLICSIVLQPYKTKQFLVCIFLSITWR